MVSNIDVKQMRLLVQLVRERKVSKVAEANDMSQQAVSAQLKRLRAAFPGELFIRKSDGLQPTDLAVQVAEKFERVLVEMNEALTLVPFDPAAAVAEVKVLVNEYALLTLIPNFIKRVREEAPGIVVRIHDFISDAHADNLSMADADLAFAFRHEIDAGLKSRFLVEDSYACVAAEGSQLAHQLEVGTLTSGDVPFVGFSSSVRDFSSVGASAGWKRESGQIVATLPCYTSLRSFLVFNDVVAIVPTAIAKSEGLLAYSTPSDRAGVELMAAWHRRSEFNGMTSWLVGIASSMYAD